MDNFFKRLLANNQGATSIEVAILFPIFLIVTFGIIEMGWFVLREADLENAVSQTAHDVYLGKNQVENMDREDVETLLCSRLSFVTDCEENVTVELQVMSSFTDIPNNDVVCREKDVKLNTNIVYENGDEEAILLLRACATIGLLSPFGATIFDVGQTANGNYQLVSSEMIMVQQLW